MHQVCARIVQVLGFHVEEAVVLSWRAYDPIGMSRDPELWGE